jgi:hypothetical protein
VPADFTMSFNSTYEFIIPPYKDDENHEVTLKIDSIPSGRADFTTISLLENKIYFSPINWK